MKILYIINGLGFASGISIGGGDKRVIEVGKRLSKLGTTIHVLTTINGYKMLKEEGLNVKYYVIFPPFSGFEKIETVSIGRIFSYIFEIFKTLSLKVSLRDYNIVYTSSDFLFDTIPAWNYKRKNSNIKWVAIIHHLIGIPWKRKGNFIVNTLNYFSQTMSFRLMKKRADLILVYATPEGSSIEDHLSHIGFSRQKVMKVINGVDCRFIKRIPEQDKAFDACFIGGLRLSKGIFDLVPIWREVCIERREAKLMIVGGGAAKYTIAMKQEIARKGLFNNITMTGPLSGETLFKLIKSCKIAISPSYEEGWGIVVCEAMACELPVVAYNLPAYEVFRDGVIKVPIGDTKAFAKAVLRLLLNEKLRVEIAKRAKRIASQFDWNRVAQIENALMEKLLQTQAL